MTDPPHRAKSPVDAPPSGGSNKGAGWRIHMGEGEGGMSDPSDADLLSRFRAGQPDALDRLLERHETPLYCFLLGMLHDPHQAEDALQETFVRALERLDG